MFSVVAASILLLPAAPTLTPCTHTPATATQMRNTEARAGADTEGDLYLRVHPPLYHQPGHGRPLLVVSVNDAALADRLWKEGRIDQRFDELIMSELRKVYY